MRLDAVVPVAVEPGDPAARAHGPRRHALRRHGPRPGFARGLALRDDRRQKRDGRAAPEPRVRVAGRGAARRRRRAGRERARAIYAQARPGYHPIAQATIDKLLANKN